jgi:hypothetical protein
LKINYNCPLADLWSEINPIKLMKRVFLIVIMAFTSAHLFSQDNKGAIILALDGSYMKTPVENGVLSNMNTVQGQNLDMGMSLGFGIKSHLLVGMGLDYKWNKEVRDNIININILSQEEVMNVKSHALIPNAFLSYYFTIIDRLFFSTKFKLGYGKINTDVSSMNVNTVNSAGLDTSVIKAYQSAITMKEYKNTSSDDFASAEIIPSLTYIMSGKFMIYLAFGGIEYSVENWKFERSKWLINFNPAYWSFGIKYNLR